MKRSVRPPNGLRKPSVTVLQFALDGNKAARVPKCDTKLVLKKKLACVFVLFGAARGIPKNLQLSQFTSEN